MGFLESLLTCLCFLAQQVLSLFGLSEATARVRACPKLSVQARVLKCPGGNRNTRGFFLKKKKSCGIKGWARLIECILCVHADALGEAFGLLAIIHVSRRNWSSLCWSPSRACGYQALCSFFLPVDGDPTAVRGHGDHFRCERGCQPVHSSNQLFQADPVIGFITHISMIGSLPVTT